MNRILKIFLFLFVSMQCLATEAVIDFNYNYQKGWHWYAEEQEKDKTIEEIKLTKENLSTLNKDQLKQLVSDLITKGIDNPNETNIYNFLLAQSEVQERAEKFGKAILKTVYMNPEFDTNLEFPTAQAANTIRYSQIQDQKYQVMSKLNDYGIYYFYSSTCSYCKAFAPIVKYFTKKYGLAVLAISVDGQVSPEFPDSKIDNGMANALGITGYPALVAYRYQDQKLMFLSYGFSSLDQIEERALVMIEEEENDK